MLQGPASAFPAPRCALLLCLTLACACADEDATPGGSGATGGLAGGVSGLGGAGVAAGAAASASPVGAGTGGVAGAAGVSGSAGTAAVGAGMGSSGAGGVGAAGGASGAGGDVDAGGLAGAGDAGAADAAVGAGGELVWPNAMSKANSDPWLVEHHDEITQLRPKVLVIDLENTASPETLVDRHIAALSEASSFHKYQDPGAEPAVVYELVKVVQASKGSRIDYEAWNTRSFADANLQLGDPDDPGSGNLTLCEAFERGVINEVWCMASANPKCGETQESKQVYDADGNPVAGRFVSASNGDNITGLGCNVTVRITDFNSGRGAGCHLHAMAHAWERYMDARAVPELGKQARRFLNWDLDDRVGAPFSTFYSACNSNSAQLTDCMIWESQLRVRSGPSAATSFDIADMSGGCGNAHFYANTTGTYSYDATTPDPTVLTSCENYGLKNGPDGEDLKTEYSNAMTDMLYGRSQRTCPPDQRACDDDCGGHGTTYLYQNFPAAGTLATNDDGTPMRNWWVYLFY